MPSLTSVRRRASALAVCAALTATGASYSARAEPPPARADVSHEAPHEHQVLTPLALYVEPAEGLRLSGVVLRFKAFGDARYERISMSRIHKGFGVEVYCGALSTTGPAKYFFELTAEDGSSAGTLGSPKTPFVVMVKNEIDDPIPALPGKRPPTPCRGCGGWPPPEAQLDADASLAAKPAPRAGGCAACAVTERAPGSAASLLSGAAILVAGLRRAGSQRRRGPAHAFKGYLARLRD